MFREYMVNGAVVFGLAIVVALSWGGLPPSHGWSWFIGAVLFYAGLETVLWFITHPSFLQREWVTIDPRGHRRHPLD